MSAELWQRHHRTARTSGLLPALTALLDDVCDGALPTGPAGHVVVPSGVAERARRIWADGVVTERASEREATLGSVALHGATLTTLRATAPATPTGPPAPRAAWDLGLLWLRLGLSEGLRDHCVSHLSARTAGDAPLLLQQMVKGQLAEAVTEHLELHTVLADLAPGELSAAEVGGLHEQITTADRGLLLLLGGSGFRADGQGQTAHVSGVLADTYAGASLGEGVRT